MALMLELEAGDSIRIGDDTIVTIERKSGQRTRLRIQSSADIAQYKAGEPMPARSQPARRAQPQPAPESQDPMPRAQLRRG